MSSPARSVRNSSLPPSGRSAPSEDGYTGNGSDRGSRQGTPSRSGTPRRPGALDLDDDGGNDNEGSVAGTQRRKKRANGAERDIPVVRDAVGESVTESFETFLRT